MAEVKVHTIKLKSCNNDSVCVDRGGGGGRTIAVLLLWDLFFATPKEFEDVALFLRLGLPSTLTRQQKNNFAKTLFKPEGFENVGFLMTSR